MAKGEKALTKFSFFGGGTAKFEDAAECFNDAGKQFVMGKAYGEGASAYRAPRTATSRPRASKFNAKKWFTNAILCALAREDVVKAKNASRSTRTSTTFVGTHSTCSASS
ncbi:hypothetical protein JL720_10011 [Aureococcus anophagefferens]|nr:hypothetical protein JL720_10011 [Aureococcus anophagefferens]